MLQKLAHICGDRGFVPCAHWLLISANVESFVVKLCEVSLEFVGPTELRIIFTQLLKSNSYCSPRDGLLNHRHTASQEMFSNAKVNRMPYVRTMKHSLAIRSSVYQLQFCEWCFSFPRYWYRYCQSILHTAVSHLPKCPTSKKKQ